MKKTNPQKNNEEEIGNLPEKEFRIIVKMIQYLGKRMEKMKEMLTKDLEELKNRDKQYNNHNEKYTRKNQQQNN